MTVEVNIHSHRLQSVELTQMEMAWVINFNGVIIYYLIIICLISSSCGDQPDQIVHQYIFQMGTLPLKRF